MSELKPVPKHLHQIVEDSGVILRAIASGTVIPENDEQLILMTANSLASLRNMVLAKTADLGVSQKTILDVSRMSERTTNTYINRGRGLIANRLSKVPALKLVVNGMVKLDFPSTVADLSVAELSIDTRTLAALRARKIFTIAELVDKTEKEISVTRYIGVVGLEQIKKALQKYDLTLRESN